MCAYLPESMVCACLSVEWWLQEVLAEPFSECVISMISRGGFSPDGTSSSGLFSASGQLEVNWVIELSYILHLDESMLASNSSPW